MDKKEKKKLFSMFERRSEPRVWTLALMVAQLLYPFVII